MMQPRQNEAGITLVEMLVALMIFAMIGVASFATLDTILRVRERTDGRLEHLARLDRALQVFGRDLAQSDPLSILLEDGTLTATQINGHGLRLYTVQGQNLQRESRTKPADEPLVQPLISAVDAVEFRVLNTLKEWRDVWPDAAGSTQALAVDMQIVLSDGKTLRRMVILPQVAPK